jgi:hypothetical protein
MVAHPHQSPEAPEPALISQALSPTPIVPAEEFFKHQGYEPSAVNMSVSQHYESPEVRRSRLKREELELKARLERETLEHRHQRLKEISVYVIGSLVLLVLLAVSITLVYNTSASLDERSWGRTSITSVLTAIGGYLFGSKSSK